MKQKTILTLVGGAIAVGVVYLLLRGSTSSGPFRLVAGRQYRLKFEHPPNLPGIESAIVTGVFEASGATVVESTDTTKTIELDYEGPSQTLELPAVFAIPGVGDIRLVAAKDLT